MTLIDPAAYAGFLKCRTNNAWPEHEKFWFSFRTGDDASGPKNGTRFYDQICETGQSSVHRARFLDELVTLIPKKIAHFGKRLKGIDDRGDHIVLRFADGTSATHSAVIGCDGVKSVTRETLLGKDNPATQPTFSGKYAYRGLIPMDEAAKAIGGELARNAQMYLGHGGHILTFPISHGQIFNVVAMSTQADGKWEDPAWQKPMDHSAMVRDFEGWIEPVQKLLGLMRKPDIWALFDHPHAPTYFKNRICMLGDAAHASTPHNGAGAGQAIEDALIMAQVMRLVHKTGDIPRAFAVFDKLRRPRTQEQVADARLIGLTYDMQAPGIGDDLSKIQEKIISNKNWLWDHDFEADIREAERLFQDLLTS